EQISLLSKGLSYIPNHIIKPHSKLELTNKSIVIKPADKGSITVIMDRNQYVKEANRQLNNPQYYQKLDKPIFPQTSEGIRKCLDSLLSAAKETWPTEYMPPGRPIVSDCGSESYKIEPNKPNSISPPQKNNIDFKELCIPNLVQEVWKTICGGNQYID
uniref:Uncharacterized protein n=1 Tax=Pygocentrus nattereri TaxID=42514 RepID=A0AAR2JGT8_PYGNA